MHVYAIKFPLWDDNGVVTQTAIHCMADAELTPAVLGQHAIFSDGKAKELLESLNQFMYDRILSTSRSKTKTVIDLTYTKLWVNAPMLLACASRASFWFVHAGVEIRLSIEELTCPLLRLPTCPDQIIPPSSTSSEQPVLERTT